MVLSRRSLLARLAMPTVAAATLFDPRKAVAALLAANSDPRPPQVLAADEDFWSGVALAFTVDRSLVNLNNGRVSPAPAFVQDAMARHLAYSNQAPA